MNVTHYYTHGRLVVTRDREVYLRCGMWQGRPDQLLLGVVGTRCHAADENRIDIPGGGRWYATLSPRLRREGYPVHTLKGFKTASAAAAWLQREAQMREAEEMQSAQVRSQQEEQA